MILNKRALILTAPDNGCVSLAARLRESAYRCALDCEVSDLSSYDLPLFTPKAANPPPADLARFRRNLTQAHALVLVVPEYNGTLPPSAINAFTWLSASGPEGKACLARKPALVATHSGAGGEGVLEAAHKLLAHLGMRPLPERLLSNKFTSLATERLDSTLRNLVTAAEDRELEPSADLAQ